MDLECVLVLLLVLLHLVSRSKRESASEQRPVPTIILVLPRRQRAGSANVAILPESPIPEAQRRGDDLATAVRVSHVKPS
eukprot:scaffold1187_cov258-Pinguiococcus_pyrenoidosus.AAC.3